MNMKGLSVTGRSNYLYLHKSSVIYIHKESEKNSFIKNSGLIKLIYLKHITEQIAVTCKYKRNLEFMQKASKGELWGKVQYIATDADETLQEEENKLDDPNQEAEAMQVSSAQRQKRKIMI